MSLLPDAKQLTEHFFRHNYAKMVAVLVRYFGLDQVEIAEDIVQDTLLEAMEKWSVGEVPHNPGGWLMDVAKKKTINRLKRDQLFQSKVAPNLLPDSFNAEVETDSTLRMIFACCHPLLPNESQVALALKTLCGLNIAEIAHALLTNEATVNKRLYRAKQKFRNGSIQFEIPYNAKLHERLENVFTTLYLLFNEGYYSRHSEKMIRMDLCFEAIRLLKEIIIAFPGFAEAKALLALMLLNVARFESRMDHHSSLIVLAEQDRDTWDQSLIAEGVDYLYQSMSGNQLGQYHLQAGIIAEHCLAQDFRSTNWVSIYQQYSLLIKMNDSTLLRMNQAIARFYTGEQREALTDLLSLQNEPEVRENALYHTALAVFQAELGQHEPVTHHFMLALSYSTSKSEQQLIRKKMET
ncbi:MAG: sigma-70 family RNA polymerase sigma factor [Bacteroidota bacterium]